MTESTAASFNSFGARAVRHSYLSGPTSDQAALKSIQELLKGAAAPVQKELLSILKNRSPEFRWEEMIQLGVRLKADQRLELSAQVLGIAAQAAPVLSQRLHATRELDALLGKGSTGLRAEFLSSRFLSEVTDAKLIVPMLAGTLVGRLAGTVATGRLAQAAPTWLTRGFGARTSASLAAYFLEVPVFAATQWALSGGAHPMEDHLKRAGLTLGVLKLAGGGSQAIGGVLTRRLGMGGANPALQVLQQTGIFGGLLTAHRLETAFGWRPETDGATTVTDTLAAMASLSVGANLGMRALGPRFAQFQTEMAARTETLLGQRNPLASGPYFEKIGEWLAGSGNSPGLALQTAGGRPIPTRVGTGLAQNWMAAQMSALPEGQGPSSGGKGGPLVKVENNPAELFPQKSPLEKPLLIRDAALIGLKTLFSVDTLQQNLKPFVAWSLISGGFMALGYPTLGLVVFIGSIVGLIGGQVRRNVSDFLDTGAPDRSRDRIHVSINRAAAKKAGPAPGDPEFQKKVQEAAQDVGWTEQLLLARQLKNQTPAVLRETLNKYFGNNLMAKLTLIREARLAQGAELFEEALELKGIGNEAYAWLLRGLGELGGTKAEAVFLARARGKNPRVRLAAAKELIETEHAALAHLTLLELEKDPPARGKKEFLREVYLALARVKLELGLPHIEQRAPLLQYWKLNKGQVDYPSLQVLRRMDDRELFEMIFDHKAMMRQQEAMAELKEKDRGLYLEIQKLDRLEIEAEEGDPAERPAKSPQVQLREKFPDLYRDIFFEPGVFRNPAWSPLARYIWNPELHPDPRATAEVVGILEGMLNKDTWGPIGEGLVKILDHWVERGTALSHHEAILARKLLESPLGSTAGVHKIRKLIDKGGHSPESLLELAWALTGHGAKVEASEIAQGLLKIPETAQGAGRLMDQLDPGWDRPE